MARNTAVIATLNRRRRPVADTSLKLAFAGLLLFIIGYFNRPEDFLGGPYFPITLIGGSLAILAYIYYLATGGHIQRTRETTIILTLLAWFVLTIPFAYWKAGTFQIVKDNISKILLLTVVMMNVINTMTRLRMLLMVQVISVAVMGWLARSHFDATGRATGNSASFGDSNELAVLLCISLPLLLFFVLEASSLIGKVFFTALIALSLYIILMTYSRTGFLALAVAAVALTWHFGIKTGNYFRVLIGGILLLIVIFALMPSGYEKLITSIYDNKAAIAGTVRGDAAASTEQRLQLLNKAIELSVKHPIFGVGLQGFGAVSGLWRAEHNTFLQLSNAAGLPALALFLILVYCTFLNLRNAERLAMPHSKIWRLAGALRASCWALLVGACFLNLATYFFPYFLIGFAAATHQIALRETSRVAGSRKYSAQGKRTHARSLAGSSFRTGIS
jgi:O-antigen ligase